MAAPNDDVPLGEAEEEAEDGGGGERGCGPLRPARRFPLLPSFGPAMLYVPKNDDGGGGDSGNTFSRACDQRCSL